MPIHPPSAFRRVPIVVALVLCAGWPGALRAAVPEILYPTARLPHHGPSQVAVSNNTLVFASYHLEDGTGGKAWVYRRSGEGWQPDAILRPPPSLPVDAVFGYSVAIAGDTIVVGAPPLAVYVFVRQAATGWVRQAAIPVPPSEAAPDFGFRVAISGDRLLVGGPSQAHEQLVGGSAYIYHRTSGAWLRDASFFDPQDDRYGSIIAIDGALAAIGSGGPIDTYLLGQHGWLRQAPVAAGNSTFSFSVSGDTLAVGGFREGIGIWQFHDGGWTQQSTLPVESSMLTLDDDTLAAVTTSGTVQVYRRQGRQGPWLLAATLVEPRADEAPGFAASIALSAGTVVASADGPVWVFEQE